MVKVAKENMVILFDELKDECNEYLRLLDSFKNKGLQEKEKDEILGEMTASLEHLSTHAGLLKEQVEK